MAAIRTPLYAMCLLDPWVGTGRLAIDANGFSDVSSILTADGRTTESALEGDPDQGVGAVPSFCGHDDLGGALSRLAPAEDGEEVKIRPPLL